MLSHVHVICFATSYAIVLVLEASRLLFRSGIRGAVMLGFAGVGLVLHSAYLFHRAVLHTRSPLSSEHDWYLIAAWVLVATYLYLVYYHSQKAFGLFLLPLTLGLIATAAFFTDTNPFTRGPASKAWGLLHGTSILLATVSVLIGFSAGLMYLSQARRLKHKRPPLRGLRLPSLEWLQRTNTRAIVVSVLMMGVGVVSGVILKLVKDDAEAAGLPWNDPVVLSSGLMFLWLLVAVALGARYKPVRQGRKVAYLTVVSFLFLVLALAVMLSLETRHGGKDQNAGPGAESSGPGFAGSGSRVRGSGSATSALDANRPSSTAHYLPPTTYHLLPTAHCQQARIWVAMNCHPQPNLPRALPAANCQLPTANCLLPTLHLPSSAGGPA